MFRKESENEFEDDYDFRTRGRVRNESSRKDYSPERYGGFDLDRLPIIPSFLANRSRSEIAIALDVES
jgi:hypothetical protein